MENLYNYVLWFNPYNVTWYAIPTKDYVQFKTGDYNIEDLETSSDIDDLITIICGKGNES
jgi:hypothetical protein